MKKQVIYYKTIFSNFVTQAFGLTILTSYIKFKYQCLSYIRHSKKGKKKNKENHFLGIFLLVIVTYGHRCYAQKFLEKKKVKKC